METASMTTFIKIKDFFYSKKYRGPYKVLRILGLKLKFKNKRLKPQSKLNYFCLHMVDHCNLNCKGCDNLAPLAQPYFENLEVFEKDFKRLSELSQGNIDSIGLMGGEPLLHPDLIKFFPIAREYFPKSNIQLITNGILLLKQNEEFWRAAAESKIEIITTKYPINIDHDLIKRTAKSHRVKFKYYSSTGTILKTISFLPFNIEGTSNEYDSFTKCHHANTCVFLRNGRMFPCSIAPNIHHFNKYFNQNLLLSEKDSIDIHAAASMNELLEFFAKPIPSCKYCSVNKRRFRLPWGTSQRNINEWLCEN